MSFVTTLLNDAFGFGAEKDFFSKKHKLTTVESCMEMARQMLAIEDFKTANVYLEEAMRLHKKEKR